MDDKKKTCIIAATLGFCWSFMLWWWLISSGGFSGLFVSFLIAAIVGGAAYKATEFLT